MGKYYTLAEDGKTPIATDMMTWARGMDAQQRTKKRETIAEGVDVSTVFLGLDHSFGGSVPVLWETMIFGGEHDGYQDRYTSHDAAMIGHEKAKRIALGQEAPE